MNHFMDGAQMALERSCTNDAIGTFLSQVYMVNVNISLSNALMQYQMVDNLKGHRFLNWSV